MASETKTARWKLVLGYTVFALVAFVVCLMLTFPYEAVRQRVVNAAADAGYAMRIGSLRPGLRGMTAHQVNISKVPQGMTPELREFLVNGKGAPPSPETVGAPLEIESVAVRPSLLPLGVAFHANLMGGSLSGSAGGRSTVQVALKLSGLDTTKGNLDAFSGVKLEGKLDGSLDLSMPKLPSGQPDLAKADGQLTFDTRGLNIQGGNVTVPMYGTPTPMDLPQIALGDLDARLRFDKGMGTLEALQAKSTDLEVQGTGTLQLGARVDMSQPNMDFRLRAEPEFVKRIGIIGAGLSILPPDKTDPNFRVAHLSGFLNRPVFGPGHQQSNPNPNSAPPQMR